eukprot:6414731-Pyramimonas_sp.AAC.1
MRRVRHQNAHADPRCLNSGHEHSRSGINHSHVLHAEENWLAFSSSVGNAHVQPELHSESAILFRID